MVEYGTNGTNKFPDWKIWTQIFIKSHIEEIHKGGE